MKYLEPFFAGIVIIFALATIPIAILNIGGGIVGGLWLIIIGRWELALSALLIDVVGTWILGFILIPSMVFYPAVLWAAKRKNIFLLVVSSALSNLWVYIVISIWCITVFISVPGNVDGGPILPFLLVAYAVSVGPWTYFASKEGNDTSNLSSYSSAEHANAFVCFGSVLLLVLSLLGKSQEVMILCFESTMLIAWVSHVIIVAWRTIKSSNEADSAVDIIMEQQAKMDAREN